MCTPAFAALVQELDPGRDGLVFEGDRLTLRIWGKPAATEATLRARLPVLLALAELLEAA